MQGNTNVLQEVNLWLPAGCSKVLRKKVWLLFASPIMARCEKMGSASEISETSVG